MLVVEDNADQLTLVSMVLRQKGYSVRGAANGLDAIEIAQRWNPAVVLLDIGLPGVNGYEVARRLRADPTVQRARLIALTGYGRESDIALAKEAGFDGHLTKPFDMDELENIIIDPIDRKPTKRA